MSVEKQGKSPEIRELIQSHRSIRKFKNKDISWEIIEDLVESARWAPSSHNVQAYSIIAIQDQETKNKLSELCGNQVYIARCPVFFVFAADFYRHSLVSMKHGTPFEMEETENLIVGAVDTALAAQNFLLTARSYGLGGVMIGGIRNEAEKVAELLDFPKWTVPIMGMCLGYPDQHPWQKPRMVKEAVLHKERYQKDKLEDQMQSYEEITEEYYTNRTNGVKTSGWGKQMSVYLSTPRRPELTSFIKKQGFTLK
ncbi:oxygen-insensitive NADPH nitroreductase [Bacillus piscicola]|uniref:oxygen-insensitive NADPH nitroreductase n=1 Tax=Bacillus piscicola TaxID=1632684 RepID=UPI001F09355F|nr:oxygen-insensitive NADPH nitroreductase [Bacillus piscicola]